MPPLPPIPDEDREHIVRHSERAWRDLARSRFFITGGTGFYGKWLLEAIAAANDELGAGVRATILSRNPIRFATEAPHLAERPEFEWIVGEPARFAPPSGGFDYLIDFATPSASEIAADSAPLIAQSLRGSENLLNFAKSSGIRRILYASSGAVYGHQPSGVERIAEDFVADPETVSPYGRLKQRTETLLLDSGIECVIARGFSFVGPYLPLNEKFAVGSFIREALKGGTIHIRGDGSPLRSYLYAADLAVWLVTILVRGTAFNAYNVGSEDSIVLAKLASILAGQFPIPPAVEIHRQSPLSPSSRYVPATGKARGNLGLISRVPLAVALKRTLDWAKVTRLWQQDAEVWSLPEPTRDGIASR